MNDPTEIKELAYERLDEAEILYQNNKFDGAFYLAGYSAELMLKAKICERLGIPNLFNDTINIPGIGDIRKAMKTHNLFVLLIFSGLKEKFDEEKSRNRSLFRVSSLLFGNWDENSRYKPCGSMQQSDVYQLIQSLKDSNGLLPWIEQN